MDIKWKKSKTFLSYFSFLLGITLLFHSIFAILGRTNGGIYLQQELQYVLEKENDYQNTEEFKIFISDRLKNFLTMAITGFIFKDNEHEDYYNNTKADANYRVHYVLDYFRKKFSSESEYYPKKAGEFHRIIKDDKNLLYSIYYDNKILYSNAYGYSLDGATKHFPSGYNFLLYFDGNKAIITKDDKDEIWYIPKYYSATTNRSTEKVQICMAVSEVPTPYFIKNYFNSFYTDTNNSFLYHLYQNEKEIQKEIQKLYLSYLISGIAGIIFLVLYGILRSYKKIGDSWFAHLCHKVLLEFKILIFLFLIGYTIYQIFCQNPDIYWILRYENIYDYSSYLGREIWASVFQVENCILSLFWFSYFIWNERRYYKPLWQQSIIYHFLKNSSQSFPFIQKVSRQYKIIFWSEFFLAACVAIIFLILGIKTPYYTSIFLYLGFGILFILLGFIIIIRYIFTRHQMMLLHDVNSLMKQISAIHNGNLTTPLSEPENIEFSEAVQDLNDIQYGMEIALKEQMQSEQLKVELVSNVSHDIKTPLTSIISYVDLLKQEDLPENLKDYVKILDDKAQRLKAMVQDVFDISKAASGQLNIHLEQLDFGKLLEQTLADMQETISLSSFSIKTDIPPVPIYILADGQRLYRVFQNLIQNALQYSLENSRIYISLKSEGNFAAVSIKNTSKSEIDENINYIERFVRGDNSRSDGGSGLGLSIAQSFTQACNGNFSVETIADLFVVTVEFPQIKNTSQAIEA